MWDMRAAKIFKYPLIVLHAKLQSPVRDMLIPFWRIVLSIILFIFGVSTSDDYLISQSQMVELCTLISI